MGLTVTGTADKEMSYTWKTLPSSWSPGQLVQLSVTVATKPEPIHLIQRATIRPLGSLKVRNNSMPQFRHWQSEIGDVIGKIRNTGPGLRREGVGTDMTRTYYAPVGNFQKIKYKRKEIQSSQLLHKLQSCANPII